MKRLYPLAGNVLIKKHKKDLICRKPRRCWAPQPWCDWYCNTLLPAKPASGAVGTPMTSMPRRLVTHDALLVAAVDCCCCCWFGGGATNPFSDVSARGERRIFLAIENPKRNAGTREPVCGTSLPSKRSECPEPAAAQRMHSTRREARALTADRLLRLRLP